MEGELTLQHFWVVGTDTDVGKTFVTTILMRTFQKFNKQVLPFKPVQTGVLTSDNDLYYYDTTMYERYSQQILLTNDTMCYCYKAPASPHYAAQLENDHIKPEVIIERIQQHSQQYEVMICEGAGGLYVPLHRQPIYYLLDLVKASQLATVLVTKTGLGTINHTLLTLQALNNNNITVLGIVFNGFENTQLEQENIDVIIAQTQLPFAVIPKLAKEQDLENLTLEQTTLWEALR